MAFGLSLVPLLNNARNMRHVLLAADEQTSSIALTLPRHRGAKRAVHMMSNHTSPRDLPIFSGCLLTMDDNHFLPEWLAYHYHTLSLRRLIVAVDPNSKTSPSYIFDRWRKHGMSIEEWSDKDFMKDTISSLANQRHKHSLGTTMHRRRQKSFYARCLQTLKEENRTWVLLIDTDEYLSLNIYTQRQNIDVEKPASIVNFLNEASSNNDTIKQQLRSPCVMIPRLIYGSMESTAEQVARDVPKAFNGSDLVTQRFRKYGPPQKLHGMAKTIIDVSRVNPKYISQRQASPHRPIFRYCPKNLLGIKVSQSPLVVRHYLGSYEQFSFRDDARKKDGMKTNKVRMRTILDPVLSFEAKLTKRK